MSCYRRRKSHFLYHHFLLFVIGAGQYRLWYSFFQYFRILSLNYQVNEALESLHHCFAKFCFLYPNWSFISCSPCSFLILAKQLFFFFHFHYLRSLVLQFSYLKWHLVSSLPFLPSKNLDLAHQTDIKHYSMVFVQKWGSLVFHLEDLSRNLCLLFRMVRLLCFLKLLHLNFPVKLLIRINVCEINQESRTDH